MKRAVLALVVLTSVAAATQDTPRAVDLLDRYEGGDFDGVVKVFAAADNVNALRRQLEGDGEAWTTARGPAAEQRRRLVAATMALEFADARTEDEWQNVDALVEWGCKLLRKGPPTAAERIWHLASIGLVEGALDDDVIFDHARHAEARFRDEPRFPFVNRYAVRVVTSTGYGQYTGTATRPRLQPPMADPLDLIDRVVDSSNRTLTEQSISSLLSVPSSSPVAAEAALRAGYLQHIISRWEPALASLATAAERSRDPYITHLAHFMMGRTLERMDQLDRAEQAYARALDAVPRAQSAVLVRAALLVRAGKAAEALSLAMASFEGPRPPDPWRLLPYGDYRDFARHIASLRAEINRGSTLVAWSPVRAITQQRPTFRARTDSVSVNVSIQNRNVPVTGLSAKDFQLLDNGVAQTIEQVAIEGVPIDLSLFLDTSTSFGQHAEELRDDIQQIIRLLRPDDRIRILGFGREVETMVGWSHAGPLPSFAPYLTTRISPTYDGIAAALLHQPAPGRRHLAIAMTDAMDYNGAVSSERVLDISGGVEGVLHLMIRQPSGGQYLPARAKQPMLRGPDQLGDGRLADAAERTGGRMHAPIFGGSLVSMFKDVFEDFRTSYVLRYTPTGVKPEGWHELKVDVPSQPKATIRARRGYNGGSPAASATAADREAAWRADLDYFAREFARAQMDFAKLYPRERFDRDLAAIASAVRTSRDADVVLALMRLVAGAQVGHTYVRFPTPPSAIEFHRLPLAFNWFSDGLAVTGASDVYRAASGLRVVSIGRMTPAQLQDAIEPYVPHENDGWLRQQSRSFMNVVEVLRAIGAVDTDGSVPLTLARADGSTFTLHVEPRPWADRQLATAVSLLGIPQTLAEKEPARYYRYEFLGDAKAVYIRYSRCENDPQQPFAAFAKELFAAIDADRSAAQRVVIDLRANGGGNSQVIEPLLAGLRARQLTGHQRLAVLTGPATFSSALMAAITLRDDLDARLVGEPPGEQLNSYGEVRLLTLPNSQVAIQYSTKFFRMARRGDSSALEPHLSVRRSLADFLAGRDPVLEAALASTTMKTLRRQRADGRHARD